MSVGLYIHIPFCKGRCYYCDFGTVNCTDKKKKDTELINQYLSAIRKEIKYYSGRKIKSIYIGGGTPSILEDEQIFSLLDSCFQNFSFNSNPSTSFRTAIEISIESNPGTLTKEKLEVMRKSGINRLSIGIQSFNDRLLKKIGRIHKVKDSIDNFYLARESGFDNINVDLIFALPTQTLKDWLSSLEEVMKLSPEHISVYNLTLEKGTKLYNWWQEGIIEKVTNDTEADMYKEAIYLLVNNGWQHYEISNFARPMQECLHNKIYWRNEEYIGIGAGATSYINGVRYTNIRNPIIYIKKISNLSQCGKRNNALSNIDGIQWQDEVEVLRGKKKIAETIILGLRMMEGIQLTQDIEKNFNNTIRKLIRNRFLEKKGLNLRLTFKGLMFANRVYQEFL